MQPIHNSDSIFERFMKTVENSFYTLSQKLL
jgi:hypothetical protein